MQRKQRLRNKSKEACKTIIKIKENTAGKMLQSKTCSCMKQIERIVKKNVNN